MCYLCVNYECMGDSSGKTLGLRGRDKHNRNQWRTVSITTGHSVDQGSATPGTRANGGTRHRNQWHTRNKCAKYLNVIFGS